MAPGRDARPRRARVGHTAGHLCGARRGDAGTLAGTGALSVDGYAWGELPLRRTGKREVVVLVLRPRTSGGASVLVAGLSQRRLVSGVTVAVDGCDGHDCPVVSAGSQENACTTPPGGGLVDVRMLAGGFGGVVVAMQRHAVSLPARPVRPARPSCPPMLPGAMHRHLTWCDVVVEHHTI